MSLIDTNCGGEFSIEMVLAVPYAYWLHNRGLLGKTISSIDSKPLYFFSSDHEERYDRRTIGTEGSGIINFPNKWIHHNSFAITGKQYDELTDEEKIKVNGKLDFSQWEFPPFKEYYSNKLFNFPKPPIIVSNKFTREWESTPINYLPISVIQEIFALLWDKYTIIYRRPRSIDHINDENERAYTDDLIANIPEVGTLTDHEYCRLVGVPVFDDLKLNFPEMTYNEFLFNLYASCDRYISVQGGNGTICSAFGKININYVKEGRELRPGYFDEDSFYYRMNNCKTILVKSHEELIQKIKEEYL